MAERRMFAKTIVDSDAFLDMPHSTQLLYFHLSMRADDEGFINNPKSIMRNIRCNNDDMNVLIAKKFIIPFESGVVVIKHWKIHNYIAKDRFKPTKYKDERAMLSLDENNSYTDCIQNVYDSDTQDRLGKDSINYKNILSSANSDFPEIEEKTTATDNRLSDIKTIIDYLNQKTHRNFHYDTASTVRHIKARLNKGYTIDDFKLVIDLKVKQWLRDIKMSKYLRPETLFGSKFEGYINELPQRKKTNLSEVDKIF